MTAMLLQPIFLVSSSELGAQKNSTVLPLDDGGFAVFWQVGAQLLGRFFGADGAALGGDLSLASGVVNYTAAQGAEGQIRLVWSSGGTDNWQINSAALQADGILANSTTLAQALAGVPSALALVALGTGFQLGWSQFENGSPQLQSLGLDNLGAAVGTALAVNPAEHTGQKAAQFLTMPDGRLIAIWESEGVSGSDIVSALFDPVSGLWSAASTVNQMLSGTQILPAITALQGGGFLAVWADSRSGVTQIYARNLGPEGQPLGDEFQLVAQDVGATPPRVMGLRDGGYAVLWEKAPGDFGDLWIQRFDAAGAPLGTGQALHLPDGIAQNQLSMSELADGRLLVSWTEGPNGWTDVKGRILDLRVSEVTGDTTISGAQGLTQLMAGGQHLTIAAEAELSLMNQHGVQSDATEGVSVTVEGIIAISASFGAFAAVWLMGSQGLYAVNVAQGGQIVAHQGTGICLGGDNNAVTNQGLIRGQAAALIGSEGRDSVVNSGLLEGAVRLMAGNDMLDCRLGRVKGLVDGGAGDDLYLVGAAGLTIREQAGMGYDKVQSLRSLTLANHLEQLDLLGSAALNAKGNALNNLLRGNSAANLLQGMAGADSLVGGGGHDRLNGGAGRDTLTGGGGEDRFIFRLASESSLRAPDLIRDFRPGQDKLDLSALTGPKLAFFGSGAFDGEKAGVRLVKSNGWLVQVDLNADGRADMAIQLAGSKAPGAFDVIL